MSGVPGACVTSPDPPGRAIDLRTNTPGPSPGGPLPHFPRNVSPPALVPDAGASMSTPVDPAATGGPVAYGGPKAGPCGLFTGVAVREHETDDAPNRDYRTHDTDLVVP